MNANWLLTLNTEGNGIALNAKDKCNILNQMWSQYRHDEEFEDFFSYNDLGLPIAVLVAEDIMPLTPRAEIYLNETWDLLIAGLEIEDKDYESLEAMFFEAGKVD